MLGRRGWCKEGVCYWERYDCEIIEDLMKNME